MHSRRPRPEEAARPGPSSRAQRRAELGRLGEDLACRVLEHAGLTIAARNWRCREGEIDIIAHTGDVLVICEVKTRTDDLLGTPAEAVTPAKQRRLRKLAAAFVAEHAVRPRTIRFDVVAVTWRPGAKPTAEHFAGVF